MLNYQRVPLSILPRYSKIFPRFHPQPPAPTPGHARSQGARDGDTLLLAAAQLPAAGAHEGVVLLRQILHKGQLGIGTCLGLHRWGLGFMIASGKTNSLLLKMASYSGFTH